MAETTAGNCLQMHQPPAITHVTQTQHTRGQSYGKHGNVPIKVLSRFVLCGSTGRWGRRNAGLRWEREGSGGFSDWPFHIGSEMLWERGGLFLVLPEDLEVIISTWQASGRPLIFQTYSNRKWFIIKDTTAALVVSCYFSVKQKWRQVTSHHLKNIY